MVLQKYLTHFASDYWFYKISWTLYGHLGVLFVWLGICACGRRFPYIVQEINQNLITGSTEKNKQNPFLVINKCWKYGKQLYQTSLQSYIILGEVHPIIDITTVHQFMENHGINFIDINLKNVDMFLETGKNLKINNCNLQSKYLLIQVITSDRISPEAFLLENPPHKYLPQNHYFWKYPPRFILLRTIVSRNILLRTIEFWNYPPQKYPPQNNWIPESSSSEISSSDLSSSELLILKISSSE